MVYTNVEDVAGHGSNGYVAHVGDVITFYIGVINTGNRPLTNIKVSDPNAKLSGPGGRGSDYGVLSSGETWNYEAKHIVTKSDIKKGKGVFKNTVTVTCKQLKKKTVTATVRIVNR
jgi:hypothetical protein